MKPKTWAKERQRKLHPRPRGHTRTCKLSHAKQTATYAKPVKPTENNMVFFSMFLCCVIVSSLGPPAGDFLGTE